MTATATDRTAAGAWDPVLRLHAQVEAAVTRQLRRMGVGVSEYRALRLLASAPEREIRLLDLADLLSLTQSSTSRLVDRLVASDSAYRESCGDDKRGVYVVITDAGAAVAERAAEPYEQAVRETLEAAAADPALTGLAAAIASGSVS
jgi:DNA-binding MarR family transcriptional regulator